MGRDFRWLWGAFTVSTFGTWFALDALPLVAILVLDAGPGQVAALAAAGLAAGALLAVPLGGWVEVRPKRRVMIGCDLLRCAALASIPVAYALGVLGLAQLLLVSVLVAAAGITSTAASGALLKLMVPREQRLAANGRFEQTMWTATVLGPPLGGAAVGLLGPVTTVVADAASYLASAAALRKIRVTEPAAPELGRSRRKRPSGADSGTSAESWRGSLGAGWRHLLAEPVLRPLFVNTMLVNALIMAAAPPLAVLMLGDLGFAPWQYGLAFALPCLGGLLGSRLAPHLATRFGRSRLLLVFGWARVVWPVGLAFVHPGWTGLALVMAVEFALILCMGMWNPLVATYRLDRTPDDRVARTLAAWSVSTKAATAAATGLWGVLAAATGPRTAIAAAGVLLLATPLVLPRRADADRDLTFSPAGASAA